MNDLYKFAKIIKELRLQYGYTQEYVASVLKISYQSYQAYELGKTIPRANNLLKLADLYDVTLGNLFGRD